jgi:hypothetical protein
LSNNSFINVAPTPVFAWLERSDYRVPGGVEMFRRVFILRVVAAADMPAGPAQPQVDPGIAHGEAFLATFAARRIRIDEAKMAAFHVFEPDSTFSNGACRSNETPEACSHGTQSVISSMMVHLSIS